MSILKNSEIGKMSDKERTEKMQDLKLELIKAGASSSKTKLKTKEIKKAIARLFTFARANRKRQGEKT